MLQARVHRGIDLYLTGTALALVLVLVLAVAGGCGESREVEGETSPSWSPDGSQITFALNGDIYVMNADRSGRTNVTNSLDDDAEPTWSPDGDSIVFLSSSQQGADIRAIRPDGSGKANLTSFPAFYAGLAWSPDSTKIAFATDRDGRAPATGSQASGPPGPAAFGSELYVMNADGTNQTRLTFNTAFDGNPTWSADGTKIAFQSNTDGDHEIYVINADGKDLTQLTDNTRLDVLPAWSPDGLRIAFASNRPNTGFLPEVDHDWDIYFMKPDGNEQLNLTDNFGIDFTLPSWSPDGRYLAFDGRYAGGFLGAKGNNEIYAMPMGGLYSFSRLTDNQTNDADVYLGPVAWSPDNRFIAITSSKTGARRVRVLEVIEKP